jgi:hypothetical protein
MSLLKTRFWLPLLQLLAAVGTLPAMTSAFVAFLLTLRSRESPDARRGARLVSVLEELGLFLNG